MYALFFNMEKTILWGIHFTVAPAGGAGRGETEGDTHGQLT
jgi:hypothetical protein